MTWAMGLARRMRMFAASRGADDGKRGRIALVDSVAGTERVLLAVSLYPHINRLLTEMFQQSIHLF